MAGEVILKTVKDVAEKVVAGDEYSFGPGMLELLPKQLLGKSLTEESLFEIMLEVSLLRFAKERLFFGAAYNYRPEKIEEVPQDLRKKLEDLFQIENSHQIPDWKRYRIQEIRFLSILGDTILHQ